MAGGTAAKADDCASLYTSSPANTGATGYYASVSLTAGETLTITVTGSGTFKVLNAAKTTTYGTYTASNAGTGAKYVIPATATYALYYSATDYGAIVGCGNATSTGAITKVTPYAVAAPAAYNFGSVNLPGSATTTLTFTFPGGGSGTVASVKVVTMGAENLDFTEAGSETCSGRSLATAGTCTVPVQFLPLRAGWRKGGVLLKNSSGGILSAAYLQGMGQGAELAYQYGSPLAYSNVPKVSFTVGNGTRLSVDGDGVLWQPVSVSIGDIQYNKYTSPYSGTSPTPTAVDTGLVAPGYDTETGQNYDATNDPNLGGVTASAVDGVGNVYFGSAACDCDGSYATAIVRVDPSGAASVFYAFTTPENTATPIGEPDAFAIGGDGSVYVFSKKLQSSETNFGLNKFDPYTASFTHIAVSGLALQFPYSAAIDSSGNLYIADGYYGSTSPALYKISGTSFSALNIGTTFAMTTLYASSLAVDSLDNLFVAGGGSDTTRSKLIYVVPRLNPTSPYTLPAVANTTFNSLGSLAFDAQDNLYVQDLSVYNPSSSNTRSIYYFPLKTATTVSFAAQAKATTSSAQMLTLTNIGNAPLSITVPSSGTNPGVSNSSFAVAANSDTNACVSSASVTIPVGDVCARFGTCSSTTANSCTIKVSSTPHVSSGATSGTIMLTGNLPAAQASFALSGMGAPGLVSFGFTGLPSSVAQADSKTTTLTALDGANATLTGYTGSVHFSLSPTDVAAALPSDYTFTGSEGGTKTFPVALSAPGVHTVTTTDSANAVFASQNTIVASGPTLTIVNGSGQSGVTGAAFALPLQVQASDASGIFTAGTVVNFTAPSSGASATLGAATCTTDATGMCSVTATANGTAGSFSVTALVGSLSATFSLTNVAVTAGAGSFGGILTPSATYTSIFNAQVNGSNNMVVGDQTTSTRFPFDSLALSGTSYVNTQITSLTVANFNGASIDDAGDLSYCYYNSGDTRINTRIPDGSGAYAPTYNIYQSGTTSARCTMAPNGTVYHAPGDGTLNVAAPGGSGFNVTAVTGAPAGIVGVSMGYILLSAAGGTYVGTVSAANVWSGALVTSRQFYNYAAYQDASGTVYLEDASTQSGYSYTLSNGTYSQAAWSKPFGVTAVAYSWNLSGTLMVASPTRVMLQFASGLSFPATVVGTSAAVERLMFQVTSAGSVGSVAVTAAGGASDFSDAGTGTCTTNGTSYLYAVGDVCTVDVKFTPTRGGSRAGTAKLMSGSTLIASAPLSGTGIGATVDHLSFTTVPTSAVLGSSFSLTVKAYADAAGTTVASDINTAVTVTSSDSAAVLPTGVNFVSGVATFSVTLNTAGSRSITAVDATGTAMVTSSGILVGTPVNHFVLSSVPATATAGTSFNVTVTAYGDSGTTVATNYTGPVKFTSTDGSAVFPTSLTLTNGTGTFTIALKTAGNQTLSVADASGSPSVTSSSIIVSAAAAATVIAVSGGGQSAIVTNAFTNPLVVQTADAYGNAVTGQTVSLVIPTNGAGLQGGTYSCSTSGTTAQCSIPVTANGTAGSYSVSAQSGTLPAASFSLTNNAKTTQTITFAQPTTPVTFGVSAITLSATSTSGLTPTFSVVSGPGTISGNTLTVTGAGMIVLAADQAGSAVFNAATQVQRTIVVNAAPQTITFTQPTSPVVYGSTTTLSLSASSTSGLTPTFSIVSGPGTVRGSTLTITGAGSIVLAADAAARTNYSAAPQVQRALVVSKASSTLTGPITQPVFVVYSQTGTVPVSIAGQFAGAGIVAPAGTIAYAITNSSSATVASGSLTIAAGTVSVPVASTLAPGNYTVTATYGGDANYSAATSLTVGLQVGQIQPVIVWSPPVAMTYGTTLSSVLNAVAQDQTAAPKTVAGTYAYLNGPSVVTASTLLAAGTYNLTINFTPTDATTYKTATGTASLTVNKATPTVSLQSSVVSVLVQNPVTLTATVTSPVSTPTGTVTFLDGTTSLGPGTLQAGVATLTTSTLAIGTHSITAVYIGDANFVTQTTTATSVQVNDFSLSISTSSSAGSTTSQTILPGGTALFNFTVTPTGTTTFPAAVNLNVSGLPAGATYTITPLTIASGAGATAVALSVTVPKQTGMLRGGQKLAPLTLALMLLPFSAWRRKRAGKLALLVLLMAGVATMSGCGSMTGFFASPQQTYNITTTGTSGALSHSTTVTLTVQ